MAYFRRSNLVDGAYKRERNKILKAVTIFLLGASLSILLANADLIINPQISNSIAYIKQFFVTSDGTSNGTLGVILQGSGVFSTKYCNLSGTNCKTIDSIDDQITSLSGVYLTGGQVDAKINTFSGDLMTYIGSLVGSLSNIYLTGGQVDAKINTLSGTLNTLARANLTCSQNQLPQFSGGAWTCGTIATVAETDPIWTAASGNYVTNSALGTALTNYVANSSLTTTLGAYATVSSLSNYYTKSIIDSRGYITGGQLNSLATANLNCGDYQIPHYVSGVGRSCIDYNPTDSRIGTITSGKWCVGNGTANQMDCTADAPITGEPLWIVASGDYLKTTNLGSTIESAGGCDNGYMVMYESANGWTCVALNTYNWDTAYTFVSKASASNTLVLSGNNVGIGTASPNGKLDVKPATDQHLLVKGVGTLNDGIRLYSADDAYSTLKGMEFGASYYYFNGGNVGIGVTGASERLEVAGKVKATEFCSDVYCLTQNIIQKITIMLTDTTNDIDLYVQNITANFLKLTGSLQVGNSGDGCAIGNAGTIRFTGGNFEGCDGSTWNTLSMTPILPPATLSCGYMDGGSYYSTQINAYSAGLCYGGSATVGSFLYSAVNNHWTWSCGSNSCGANEKVDGTCDLPTNNCSKGYFDTDYGYQCSVGGGYQTWQCFGINGGSMSPLCQKSDTLDCPLAGCFVAGTMVTMADGTKKAIETIGTGEILLGGEASPNQIEKLFKIYYQRQLYSLNGGNYFVSDTHPFMTTEGWESFNPAGTLKENPDLIVTLLHVGDILVTDHGFERLVTVDSHLDPQYVYNFRTYGNHTYYADGFLVHNVYQKPAN